MWLSGGKERGRTAGVRSAEVSASAPVPEPRHSGGQAPEEECVQPDNLHPRLSLIPTLWSLVYRAHQGPLTAATPARKQLLERYGGAVHRYLRAVLHEADAADEVFQEFAFHLLHGDLRGADPQRGRFRNFVKGTLFHLIADYHKQQRRWPGPLPVDEAALPPGQDDAGSDRQFLESWCDELLARAWAALAAWEAETGQASYTVLRFRADHPEMRSPEMAEQLAAQLGRPFTAAGVRQTLHRAREKFADLLLNEVMQSLQDPTAEQLEQELAELRLLEYCQPALVRCRLSE
jgi:RNA polymerase sigma-70 factor (ECF subfamily)